MKLLNEVRDSRRLPTPSDARSIRLSAGVSQARFAQELGVCRMTLARWESGERRPRQFHQALWANLLAQLSEAIK